MSYDKKLSIGDRRSLMSITSNIPLYNSTPVDALINGSITNDTFSFGTLSKVTNNMYIKFNFRDKIILNKLKLLGSGNSRRGIYDIYGSNNDNDYELIIPNVELRDSDNGTHEVSINSNKAFIYYKFIGNNTGEMSSYGWLYELQFDYDINGYYLINKNNDYYNIDNSNYDIGNKEYKSLINTTGLTNLFIDNNLSIEDLFVDNNINDETFKPINKFDNFRISKLVTL